MIKLTTLLKNFKNKIAAGAVGAVLVASPGVALAHGGSHHQRSSDSHRNWSDNNWKRHHHNHDDNNWDKTCEERQARADQRVANYKAKAQERYNGLSTYLFNQQTFVTDNNLTIENYDKYNEKAMNKQTKAQEALDNTSAPTIDCGQWQGKDKWQIRHAKNELKEAIEKFENSVQKLSYVIADNVVVS
jgi:hypothetical protein